MDTAIVTTRLVDLDAMSNFTMASAAALKILGKVSVYAFAYERPPIEGVDIRFLGEKNNHTIGTNLRALASTFKLAGELSKYDVLIIVNPDVGSILAYHLAKRYNRKLKVIWTFHGLTPTSYVDGFRDRWLMSIRKWAYIRSMKRSEHIQVFSDFIKTEVVQWGVKPYRVTVLPLGVELNKMSWGDGRRIREKYGVGNGFLLLYVGRIVKFKHVDEIIRAVSKLDGVSLLVVGGGPEREPLEKLSGALHVEDRVRFAGRVPDAELPDYYAACDAWATASRHEGFCVPIIEAMAAGKPVVVPDVAAMPETAGDAGLVYQSGDMIGLVDSIKRLALDKRLYAGLSARASEHAAGHEMSRTLNGYVDHIRSWRMG